MSCFQPVFRRPTQNVPTGGVNRIPPMNTTIEASAYDANERCTRPTHATDSKQTRVSEALIYESSGHSDLSTTRIHSDSIEKPKLLRVTSTTKRPETSEYQFFLIRNSDIHFRHGKTFSENRIAATSKSVFARPFHADRTLKRYWLTTLQLRDIPYLYCDRNNNAPSSENSPANDKNLQLFEQK